jgi:hypothetical protein
MAARYQVCIPVLYLPPFILSAQLYCMMSAYLYNVCSMLWCLPICVLSVNYMMSAYLFYVCLAVWFLPTHMMFVQLCHVYLQAYLFDVCSTIGLLPTCVVCSTVYDVCILLHMISCLPLWRLPICMTSVYFYYFCLRVWCLPKVWCLSTCTVSAPTCIVYMSAQLYNVCLPILPGYLYKTMSSYLSGVCLPVWWLLSTTSSFLYCIFLPLCFLLNFTVWCPPTCIMYAQCCDVCPSVCCLFNYMMSAYLYDVCLAVWFLPTRMMFVQLCHVYL